MATQYDVVVCGSVVVGFIMDLFLQTPHSSVSHAHVEMTDLARMVSGSGSAFSAN